MAALHIRRVDDVVLDELKRRAARNKRSLQGEVLSILESAARPRGRRQKRPLALKTVRVGRKVAYTRDVIYEQD